MTPHDPGDPLAPLRHDDGGMPSIGADTLAAVMGRGRKLRQRRRGLYSAGTAVVIASIAIAGISTRGGSDGSSFDRVATSPSPTSGSPSPQPSPGQKHNGSGPGSVIVSGNPGGGSGHHGGGSHHPTSPPPVPVCDTPTASPPTVEPTATALPTPCPSPSATPTESPTPTDSPSPPPPTDSPTPTTSPETGNGLTPSVTSSPQSASR
jgi:hypothetical protein